MDIDNSARLIVFCKQPVPARVKTRMVPPLTYNEAALLYDAFLKETVNFSRKIKGVERILSFYPPESQNRLNSLIDMNWTTQVQQGNNFSQRLLNAFKENLSGNKPVVVIGSDSPSLPPDLIYAAFKALEKHKIVIGPAIDGGFYLLGLKEFYTRIFDQVRWSSKNTLSDTLKNIRHMGIEPFMLPEWYDVDDIYDLKLLVSHLSLIPENEFKITREAIKNILQNKEINSGYCPKI
ncbi:MAG: TIGR04282 family arsenosugar biosynthesis glycosyltransferase [Actinomycetota bacterium]